MNPNTLYVCCLLGLLGLTYARGPPTLSSHIQTKQIVHAGDTVRLACPVNSDPPALTSWSKDSEDINIGWERFRILERSLRIRSALPEDSGQYICTATNGFGTVSVTYELYVLADDNHTEDGSEVDDSYTHISTSSHEDVAPRFSHAADMRRAHITHRIGETARFRCRARGRPQPQVVWFKDGDLLSGENRPVLRLPELNEGDSGQYTCTVSNVAGSVNFTYTLDVVEILMEKPTLIAPFPDNQTVDIDDTVSFVCQVRSDLKTHVQWLKRVAIGSELPTNRTIVIEGKPFMVMSSSETQTRQDGTYRSKLSIPSAQSDDAGLYLCLAANRIGYSFISAHLTVKSVKPRFTRPDQMEKSTMMRPVGSTVRFDCRASGKPTPRITWFKDGHPLAVESARKPGDGHWSLQLTELRQIDNGRYTCQLTNSAGSVNFTYTLEVVDLLRLKPILEPPHPQNSTVVYGGSTSFFCRVRSAHQPHIQWLKRIDGGVTSVMNATFAVDDQHFVVLDTGRALARQNGAYVNKLTIRSARASDAGMYVCLGANSVGYSVRRAYLTVLPDLTAEDKNNSESFMDGASIPLIIGVPVAVLIAIIALTLYVMCRRRQQRRADSPTTAAKPKAVERPSYQMGVPDRRYIYTAVPHPSYPASSQLAGTHANQTPHSFSHSHNSFSPVSHTYSPAHHVPYRPAFDAEQFSSHNYSDVRTETSSPTIPLSASTAPSLQYAGMVRHA